MCFQSSLTFPRQPSDYLMCSKKDKKFLGFISLVRCFRVIEAYMKIKLHFGQNQSRNTCKFRGFAPFSLAVGVTDREKKKFLTKMSCHGKRSRGDETDVRSKTERTTLDPEQPLCHSQSSSSPAVKILPSDSNLLAIGFANLYSSVSLLHLYMLENFLQVLLFQSLSFTAQNTT